MNSVLEAIKNRQSTRSFKQEQLAEEELSAIIEAGLQAPSGHNDQPWFFTVIQNKEMIDELSSKTKEYMRNCDIEFARKMGSNEKFHVLYNAPTVILVSYKKDAVSPVADVSAAIENMLLAAESLNIGSCWVGFTGILFGGGGSIEGINIKEGYEAHYSICLGYKDQKHHTKKPTRKLDVVEYIK